MVDLTLARLNEVTHAWVEQDYHRTTHSEIGTSPLRRYLDSPCVGRDCPNSDGLRRAFRCTETRRQRRSDGTISLAGKRFEIPSRYRHLEQVRLEQLLLPGACSIEFWETRLAPASTTFPLWGARD